MAWTNNEWQTWYTPEKGEKLRKVLKNAGFSPYGYINGRPMVGKKDPDWDEISDLAAGLNAIERDFGIDEPVEAELDVGPKGEPKVEPEEANPETEEPKKKASKKKSKSKSKPKAKKE